MKLVPGDLYFIAEIDVLTGQTFDYFKIGLVKESRQGDSIDRAGEHQTGNPRRLIVRETVSTPAINALETYMHDVYATERIFGEWFHLPGRALEAAIKKAQEKAAQQNALVKATKAMDKYATVASSDKMLKATAGLQELHKEVLIAQAEAKAINTLFDLEKAKYQQVGDPTLVADFYGEITKSNSSFDKEALESAFPKIFKEFLSSTAEVKGSLRFIRPKEEIPTLSSKLADLIAELQARINAIGPKPKLVALQEMHYGHLELLGYLGEAKWREDRGKTEIGAAIKGNLGIEGVAKWSRVSQTTESFDQRAFKVAHPDLAEKFTKRTTGISTSILDMRSYAYRQ